MGESSKIEWTHHTFSPWRGCEKVSPACRSCYAESWARRWGFDVWGKKSGRRFFGDKHWNEPLKWERAAKESGERHRVFCASMADVFEDRPDLGSHRARVLALVEATPNLDWLLLTKRPENVRDMVPLRWLDHWPVNAWMGTTVEDQERANERIPILLEIPAAIRFLSCEPLLGPVDLAGASGWSDYLGDHYDRDERGIDWVIVGSESGPGARPMQIEWARSLVDQCRAADVAVFVKQIANAKDRKGGDPAHWPAGIWPREFPKATVPA